MGRPSLTWASLRWNAASLSALSWQHSPLAATGTLGPARSRQLAHTDYYKPHRASVQRVPEPDPLPGIPFDTRPDPIQFEKSSGSG